MKSLRNISGLFVVAAILAVVVAGGIFVLTEQPPEATAQQSGAVNELLVRLLGGTPLYDPATDSWLGIGIRRWAHAAEFWLLGVFVALASWLALKPRLAAAGVVSLCCCAAASLFDQCHKLFVPGRHFDGFDLVMDALGYGVAILTVLLAAKAVSAAGRQRAK